MTVQIKTELNSEWKCWVAYTSDCLENSDTVGEGKTREDAIADYWYGVHNGKTASLLEPDYSCNDWQLYDGFNAMLFDTREAAIVYAETHQYIISTFAKEV